MRLASLWAREGRTGASTEQCACTVVEVEQPGSRPSPAYLQILELSTAVERQCMDDVGHADRGKCSTTSTCVVFDFRDQSGGECWFSCDEHLDRTIDELAVADP